MVERNIYMTFPGDCISTASRISTQGSYFVRSILVKQTNKTIIITDAAERVRVAFLFLFLLCVCVRARACERETDRDRGVCVF